MEQRDIKELRTTLRACRGNMAQLGRRLGITRQGAKARVALAGLAGEAAKLRTRHGVPGARSALVVAPEAETKRIKAALLAHDSNQTAAAKALGIGRTRLQRSMIRLKIAP